MNSTKILFVLALITFSCITFSQSIKCYTCDTKESCKKPKQSECTAAQANYTRAYLELYHVGVNVNTTGPNFECFREELKVSTGEIVYKGCTYQNIQGCNMGLRDFLMFSKYERYCNQCSHKDGCNPAGRVGINMMTIFGTIVVALIARYVWH